MANRYPHMLPDDVPVWERWLQAHPDPNATIDYDVKVGRGIDVREDIPDPWASMAVDLSMKRIDAIITSGDTILIIEVKKIAGWTAIGQILGYPVIFINTYHPTLAVSALLVTESFTLDTRDIMDFYHLPYEIMPPPAAGG